MGWPCENERQTRGRDRRVGIATELRGEALAPFSIVVILGVGDRVLEEGSNDDVS